MTQRSVERAVVSSGEAVGTALENFERRIIERFNSLLEAERSQWLDVRDMVAAVANELAAQRTDSAQQRGEMLAGIHGLQQQLSEYEALVPPDERVKIATMVYRHEAELEAIRTRLAALEAAGDGD